MTLSEFCKLTKNLDGDLEFVCAGAPINIVWHDDGALSIDDGNFEPEADATVLFGDGVE